MAVYKPHTGHTEKKMNEIINTTQVVLELI